MAAKGGPGEAIVENPDDLGLAGHHHHNPCSLGHPARGERERERGERDRERGERERERERKEMSLIAQSDHHVLLCSRTSLWWWWWW